MAEAVFRHKVKEAGLERDIVVDSVGTGDWHEGETPHQGTCELLREKDIDFSGIVARKIEKRDVENADYVVAMDADNMRSIRSLADEANDTKITKLMDFVPRNKIEDVPDPYFTGNFDEVYNMVDEGCDQLLAHIREQSSI